MFLPQAEKAEAQVPFGVSASSKALLLLESLILLNIGLTIFEAFRWQDTLHKIPCLREKFFLVSTGPKFENQDPSFDEACGLTELLVDSRSAIPLVRED
jgi:hypothetical protein